MVMAAARLFGKTGGNQQAASNRFSRSRNRGLNPHIEDIARRLGLDNFIAFAPMRSFPLGGYPGTEDKARELFPKLEQAKPVKTF